MLKNAVEMFELQTLLVCLIRKDATMHDRIYSFKSTCFTTFERRSRRQQAQILGPEGLALAPTTRLPAHTAAAYQAQTT